ncbi:MAG TPA: nucleotidyl transferase AbiEii/AbiGii toxin family protein [Blastocatellia bacterium]|nr:nucleotidyl transferase AbiEii/AbiGii toxin family protein [Blastocatellia bacterium]
MKREKPTNLPASIRDRLLKIAKQRGEEFQNLLISYALERWLYRLSRSQYRDRYLLKGAMLFALWTDEPHRATQDLDLLGYGANSIAEVERIFLEICLTECEADGLEILPASVQGNVIREDRVYEGVRIHVVAMLGNARIPLQIDVGFGDSVVPAPIETTFPTLLDLPAPRLRAYRMETAIAEKFHAMIERGISNSRMKDYYDIWILAGTFEFDGATLSESIRAVFERRQTAIPQTVPIGLSTEYAEHPEKQAQWRAFVRRGKLKSKAVMLPEVIARLNDFLMPVISLAAREALPNKSWKPNDGWK